MARFLTVDLGVIDSASTPWILDFGKVRTDGLYDASVLVSNSFAAPIAVGVSADDRLRLAKICVEWAASGVLVDVRDMGTGAIDAPSIIRPNAADLNRIKVTGGSH